MESTLENRLLKLPPGAMENIKKIHNLIGTRLEEAIKILEDWIQKEDHIIKKDFGKDYLDRTLLSCKGSVEKSKKQIDRLCTMKTLVPKFFSKVNAKEELKEVLEIVEFRQRVNAVEVSPEKGRGVDVDVLEKKVKEGGLWRAVCPAVDSNGWMIPLPIITEDYYRVIIIKFNNKNFTTESFMHYYQYHIILHTYIKARDYVNGFIVIIDFRELNLFELMSKLNTVELQQYATIMIEGYSARLKEIHMLTNSKAIDLLVKTFKHLLSEKIGNRIHVQPTIEDLHKVVPKEILPVEYGGTERSIKKLHAEWVEAISSEEHVEYMKIMNKPGTDETKRLAVKFNEDYMGLPGSFRCLSVD